VVNEKANVFHGPFLASFVSGLRETSLSISTSHEVDDVFTYIIDRSHEVLVGSRRRYLTRSPLNIILRGMVGASLWAGGVDNVLCFDPSTFIQVMLLHVLLVHSGQAEIRSRPRMHTGLRKGLELDF